MRIGVFGGSFDPVHYGHLLLAETCRDQCPLDRVIFVPAATPPHKRGNSRTDAQQRVEMLRLAIGGHAGMEVSTMEIDRGGISYTVDTLKQLQEIHPDDELFFLMGADSLADLPSWRSPEEICRLACPLVVRRAGSPVPNIEVLTSVVDQDRLELIRQSQVEMPVIELSSTAIRSAVQEGRSIRFQTPRAVEVFIQQNGLFSKETT